MLRNNTSRTTSINTKKSYSTGRRQKSSLEMNPLLIERAGSEVIIVLHPFHWLTKGDEAIVANSMSTL
jgi:hypothetical protein